MKLKKKLITKKAYFSLFYFLLIFILNNNIKISQKLSRIEILLKTSITTLLMMINGDFGLPG